MQAHVWFLEAEPRKHSVIVKSWIGISGPVEIVGAFCRARRCRPNRGSDLRQIVLGLLWTFCEVFRDSTTFGSCHGSLLPSSSFLFQSTVEISSASFASACDPLVKHDISSFCKCDLQLSAKPPTMFRLSDASTLSPDTRDGSAGSGPAKNSAGQVLFASLIGTTIEFFDFYIYATAAVLVFPRLFFPKSDPMSATLASLATFAIAFFARPFGSALFGHFGDRIGRKATLVAALLTMGISTVAIGALPTYASCRRSGAVAACAVPLGSRIGPRWRMGRRGFARDRKRSSR